MTRVEWLSAALRAAEGAEAGSDAASRRFFSSHGFPQDEVENLFAKLKDWRRLATRYDRCAHTFFSAICIAAAVIFWL